MPNVLGEFEPNHGSVIKYRSMSDGQIDFLKSDCSLLSNHRSKWIFAESREMSELRKNTQPILKIQIFRMVPGAPE